MGRDHSYIRVSDVLRVSIHAPTWGATQASQGDTHDKISFNPRAHMGRDGTLA